MAILKALVGFLLGNFWRSIALVLCACVLIQAIRLDWAQDARDMAIAKHDAHLLQDVAAMAQAENAARQAEADQRAALDAAAARHEKDKADALAHAESVADSLRDGSRRVRNEWAACETARRVSEATAGAGEPDAADGLRAAGIGRVLGIVGTCQAQRDGLIDAIRALTGHESDTEAPAR